jgi:MFS family permease
MMAAVSGTWALLLGMALLMIGNGLQGTLLGVRASLESFATSTTGILMSGYYVGFLAGSALAPRLVARVGHVRVFGALASLASVAILVHALFVGPATWLAMRLMSGFAYAGLYVVAESWLNEEATNATRGRLLSVYMVVSLGGVALGQVLLNLADPRGPDLFVLVSVLVSLGLVPMLLSASRTPAFEAPSAVGLRELYDVSPTGVVGMFITMIAQGAFFGMGAVYASEVGLSVGEISLFMGLALVGGVLLQWPIGRLSDAFDRRQVIVAASLLAAFLAFAAALLGDEVPRLPLFVLVSLFGGVLLPMYSLCIAYTNDYLRPDQMVDASGTLVLVGGLGACFGPISAGLAMAAFGPAAFFWWQGLTSAGIGAFALYRMTRRPALPLTEQGAYVATPRTTPYAAAMGAEVASGQEADGSHQTAREGASRGV